MSVDTSVQSPSSLSESSSSSASQVILMMQKGKDDLTLYGSPAPMRLSRSATVRRASTITSIKSHAEFSEDDSIKKEPVTAESHQIDLNRYRKSLDSTYRHSLESISENRTKHRFGSSACLFAGRDASSIESTSSDCTDYAIRSATELSKDKTFVSTTSSYLGWIESVNSEYFGSANPSMEVIDADTKVGEWNNFWLNYNSANNRYLSSPYLTVSNDEKEELSDAKSTSSTQREFTEKQISMDQIFLSHDEVLEALRCSQKITEILQNAIKRNENDIDDSRNDSYYSQMLPSIFSTFRTKIDATKERTRSYSLEPQELQRQKQMLKPPTQSTNSCINVLLNTGVADILKRVISKRKDTTSEEIPPASRNSFSDWSTAK